MENPAYLGDAVYAYFDGFGVELRLSDHRNERAVYLEPQVLAALVGFMADAVSGVVQTSEISEADGARRRAVTEALESKRAETKAALEGYLKCENILALLPDELIPHFNPSTEGLIAYNLTRANVAEIMKSLHAGKWAKQLNGAYADKIDYVGEVDGVKIELWAAAPPDSCKIVEDLEEVPAHTRIRRTLVCK